MYMSHRYPTLSERFIRERTLFRHLGLFGIAKPSFSILVLRLTRYYQTS